MPTTDFQDDGGTPRWRALQAERARILEMQRPGLVAWWRRKSTIEKCLIALLVSFGGPWAILALGLTWLVILEAVGL